MGCHCLPLMITIVQRGTRKHTSISCVLDLTLLVHIVIQKPNFPLVIGHLSWVDVVIIYFQVGPVSHMYPFIILAQVYSSISNWSQNNNSMLEKNRCVQNIENRGSLSPINKGFPAAEPPENLQTFEFPNDICRLQNPEKFTNLGASFPVLDIAKCRNFRRDILACPKSIRYEWNWRTTLSERNKKRRHNNKQKRIQPNHRNGQWVSEAKKSL